MTSVQANCAPAKWSDFIQEEAPNETSGENTCATGTQTPLYSTPYGTIIPARVERGLWKLFLDTTFQARLNRICSAQVVGGWYFAIAHNRHCDKVFHNPGGASSDANFRGNQRYQLKTSGLFVPRPEQVLCASTTLSSTRVVNSTQRSH